MNKALLVLSLASALAFAAGTVVSAKAQTKAGDGIARGTAKKQKPRRQAPRESGYVACTFVGCIKVPPGCRPVTDYDFDGMPTGFDAILCPNGKFYSRS